MAGHAQYTALLDACVLYPVSVTDALLSIAVTGLYAPKWTTEIEAEWMRNLAAERPELAGRLDYRRDNMRDAIPDWEVPETAWRALTGTLQLPDIGDVHVLAAAIAGYADCIVTANLKDFPADVLAVHGLKPRSTRTTSSSLSSTWNRSPCSRPSKRCVPAPSAHHIPSTSSRTHLSATAWSSPRSGFARHPSCCS
ncbi:PIN domain-containing protein [Variovorax sp. WS11]|uniref:PIN domain-containing protein n=1 Tax=Variovorax sp. WS11 TaxID=1105204 RepID=UPI001EF26319|nr:PIN domain-containing protein [Variovorax sp. WS11]